MKGSDIVKTTPRKWTEEEVAWCQELRDRGYKVNEIAESIGRDLTSTQIKLKRIKKTNNTYNDDHLKQKYSMNDDFFRSINPDRVCDVFCGERHYWKDKCKCISNDIDKGIEADYHMDAHKFICSMYLQGEKFDIVDLDPYGSAFDCLDIALKIAKKGLIVTYGELGHKRWKRLDYVRHTYGIDSLEDFKLINLMGKTNEIARHNHKELEVYCFGEWRNIARVYYKISPRKITEQWEGSNGRTDESV